jgi:hypothetical protein
MTRTFNVTFVHEEFIIMTTITNNNLPSVDDNTDITSSQDAYESLVYHASMTIQDGMPLAVQLGDMKTFLVKWASDITIEEVNE